MGYTNKLSVLVRAFLPLIVVLSFYCTSQTRATPLVTSTSSIDEPILAAIREQLGIVPAAILPSAAPSTSAENIAKFIKKKKSAVSSSKSGKAPVQTISKALAAYYGAKASSPIWVSKEGLKDRSLFVLAEFENADDYGLRNQDFRAPQKLLTSLEKKDQKLTDGQLARLEITISKTALRYIRYARGGRINPKRLSRFQGRGPVQPNYIKALNTFSTTTSLAEQLLSYHPKHKQFEALRQKLILLHEGSQKSSGKKRDKLRARLLVNMERWRWMPEKMQGDNNIFVWANVPELRVRIIRKGKQVFTERAIVGQVRKQSPMFSDKIEWIEFNPTWFIPNSIKVADILPSLRRKGRVVKKYHLKINCGKHGTNWRTIDWKKVDIRSCSVIQPTGGKSVLGKLKFKFPNKYAVYMHDTLTPGLFNRKHRILSHGCIRVRNPRRMAEVLLANDKGMSATRVGTLLARGGLHTEHLKRSIPVHITYFSTRVQEDGSLKHFPDYYGHDKRLAKALLGKGHLFKGAIYGGRKRYKRKYKRTVAPSEPNFLPGQ